MKQQSGHSCTFTSRAPTPIELADLSPPPRWNALAFQITSLIADLLQAAHLFGLFKEEPDRFFQILNRPLLRSTTGRQVEFPRVRNEGATFLENLGGELNLHTLFRLPVG